MTYKIHLFLLLMLCSPLLFAQQRIAVSELGQLQLNYAEVIQVEAMELRTVNGNVTYKTGEAFQLVAPFEAQRHEFLVNNGERVIAGQAVMQLSGSEVHHFMEQFEAAESMYKLAESRYEANKKLFQQKSISNDTWQSIAQHYFDTKIEYGHFRHFNELIHSIKSEDEMVIQTPLDGYFIYPDTASIQAGELKLGQVIPINSLRIQAYIGTDVANSIKYFQTASCRIETDTVSQVSEGYFQKVWSKPLTEACQLVFGQAVPVTPLQSVTHYQVPKTSVFSIDRGTYILILLGNELIVTAIDVINSNEGYYYIDSTTALQGVAVLTSSVSAVQGVLMGFGGE